MSGQSKITSTLVWHDAHKTQPDDETAVLVCDNQDAVWIGYLEGGAWHWSEGNLIQFGVRLWADLPAPPPKLAPPAAPRRHSSALHSLALIPLQFALQTTPPAWDERLSAFWVRVCHYLGSHPGHACLGVIALVVLTAASTWLLAGWLSADCPQEMEEDRLG